MKELVSVIVPVFKAHDFIERCAISLMEQTYENIEYLFVNDCTPDDSIEILQNVLSRYANRENYVKIINFEINQGHAHARNVALKQCSGKYVIQIDADDWIEPVMIEHLISLAEKENADICCCGYFKEFEDRSECVFVDPKMIGRFGLKHNLIYGLQYSAHWNKLVLLSLIRENDIYCVEGTNNWVDVGQITPLRYMANKIVSLDECLYHYNCTNINSVSKHMSPKRRDDMLKIAGVVSDYIDNHSDGEMKLQTNYLKFNARIKIIMIMPTSNDYKIWRSTFPETNKYLWRFPMGMIKKIIYQLIIWHIDWPHKFIKRLARY